MRTVLFLCTGNYYRSRFSEYLFNYWAEQRTLDWRAGSRGLSVKENSSNVGPISKYTRARLLDYGITLPTTLRFPQPARAADFMAAHQVIAVDASEHRPLMQSQFPDWAEKIEYWLVHDIDRVRPDLALEQLEQHLQVLLSTIR